MTNVRRKRWSKCRSKVLEKVRRKGSRIPVHRLAIEGSRDNSPTVTEEKIKDMAVQMQG